MSVAGAASRVVWASRRGGGQGADALPLHRRGADGRHRAAEPQCRGERARCGDEGLDIFLPGFPRFVSEPCDATAVADVVESTTDSPSGLTYDPATGQYTFVWKSGKSLAGRCGRFELGLKDGSAHAATFAFTR